MSTALEKMTEKPYTLRKLQACDIVPFAKIIGKIGIDEMISCYVDEDFTALLVRLKNRRDLLSGEADPKGMRDGENAAKFPDVTEDPDGKNTDAFVVGAAVAARIANKILLKMDCCMNDVFDFLSGLSGLTRDEVSQLDLEVFLQMVMDVAAENNMANFFRAVKKLLE